MNKRNKRLKRAGRLLLLILAGAAVLAVGIYVYLTGRTNYVSDDQIIRQESTAENMSEELSEAKLDPDQFYDITAVRKPTQDELADCYTMLIICGESQEEQSENGGMRQDAEGIILMTINPAVKEMFFTTLHADLYVRIPESGGGRLGHAYAIGGGPLLAETIRDNYGVEIGNYAMISLRDVARELEMEEFENMDISRDGLDVVEKLIYSLNYDNPFQVAGALNRILSYVTHNMSAADITRLTMQIPVVLPYYSEKYRLPLGGEYQEIDGYLVADAGEISSWLQARIYAHPQEETETKGK